MGKENGFPGSSIPLTFWTKESECDRRGERSQEKVIELGGTLRDSLTNTVIVLMGKPSSEKQRDYPKIIQRPWQVGGGRGHVDSQEP